MRKVIIIGLGKMGNSHLDSFLLKSNEIKLIYLIDKDKEKLKTIKKKVSKFHNNKFFISRELPRKKFFDFAVIATNPNERYQVAKKLIQRNQIRIILFEKFLFNKISEYSKMKKILQSRKIKAFVNIWSLTFMNRIGLKSKKKNLNIKVQVSNNKILTNLIHFYELFKIINGNKIYLNFDKLEIKKKKSYFEGKGSVILKSSKSNNNKMVIETHKKVKVFKILFANKRTSLKITYKNGKLIKSNSKRTIDFPLASKTTNLFFQKLNKKKDFKDIEFPTFINSSIHSKIILRELKNKFNKKVFIR